MSLTESMNMFGMSISKFKRMLKLLLSDFFNKHEFYYVHNGPEINLKSPK